MEKGKLALECSCGSHILLVTNDVELNDNDKRFHQEFFVSMFSYGKYNEKPGLLHKLRVAWNYLRTGKMHEDQVILSREEAEQLIHFIDKEMSNLK